MDELKGMSEGRASSDSSLRSLCVHVLLVHVLSLHTPPYDVASKLWSEQKTGTGK